MSYGMEMLLVKSHVQDQLKKEGMTKRNFASSVR